jgi:hypothetical protein
LDGIDANVKKFFFFSLKQILNFIYLNSLKWECKADLNKAVKFGELKVSCEGYDYPNDEYILAGSCGV